MIPTCQQVLDGIRGLLGETSAPSGGGKYTDAYLRREAFLPMAFRDMFRELSSKNISKIRRHVYPILPIYQAALVPAAAGIQNLGTILSIRTRSFLTGNSLPVASMTIGPSITDPQYCDLTVTAGHPFQSGWYVTCSGARGISDDVNDQWMGTRISSTVFRLNGCRAAGVYLANTATVTYSQASWSQELRRIDDEILWERMTSSAPPATTLSSFAWINDAIRFLGAAIPYQLDIYHTISGAIPSQNNASLGVDDCQDFLMYRTAAAVASRFDPIRSDTWSNMAAEFLRKLAAEQVKDQQAEGPISRPLARPRRIHRRII